MRRAAGLGLDYGHLEKQRLCIDKCHCSSAIVASGIAGSDHRDWQPKALAMATTDTSHWQSIIQSVSDTTSTSSTGSSCTPLSQCAAVSILPGGVRPNDSFGRISRGANRHYTECPR